jgi:hypothetical protein
MVCDSCKERKHEKCKGDTWCDCQHRTDIIGGIEKKS